MSYSRWSHSWWYTYWDVGASCSDPLLATRLNQKMTILSGHVDTTFSYRQLKEDIDFCIRECDPLNECQAEELREYMKEFMRDVEGLFDE